MGITLDQGLKRMYESMPTTEVGFFSIVMTIQSKSDGNLSEELGNLDELDALGGVARRGEPLQDLRRKRRRRQAHRREKFHRICRARGFLQDPPSRTG